MATQADIVRDGHHLEQVRQVMAAIGLTVLSIMPEVAVHCSEEQARALATFTGDVIKPICENIDAQLAVLEEQYTATKAEVEGLEKLLTEQ